MAHDTKACSRCNTPKPLDAFGAAGGDRLRSLCKPCHAAVENARYHRRRRALGFVPEKEWGERWLANVDDSGDCWLWTGFRDNYGYGKLGVAGSLWGAHRLSYLLHRGDLPKGCFICHHCDNPPCVNPEHLYAGTVQTNSRDAVDRGRYKPCRGEANGSSYLSDADVVKIRNEYATEGISQRALARRHGMSQAQIWNIVNRKQWAHL